MEINGKEIQLDLLEGLKKRISELKKKGVTPGIAIVTLGPEATWEAYVTQKIKLADSLGINRKLINLNPDSTDDVLKDIETLNSDSSIHGLIVQRPFPTYIDTERIIQSVSKYKDIDGFRDDSKFDVPVWLAVRLLITRASELLGVQEFQLWLSNQSILIVGKGGTGGGPVINALRDLGIKPQVMDSKTKDTESLFRKANIIVFGTGRRINVPLGVLKKNCVLIGIGLHRDEGILRGDFDDIEAKKNGLYYSPSPGGVGPLNLYFLFENLVTATENSLDK